jgi:hypothetical protein
MFRFTNLPKSKKKRFLSEIQAKFWRRKRDHFWFNIIETKMPRAALDFVEDDIKHERISMFIK